MYIRRTKKRGLLPCQNAAAVGKHCNATDFFEAVVNVKFCNDGSSQIFNVIKNT